VAGAARRGAVQRGAPRPLTHATHACHAHQEEPPHRLELVSQALVLLLQRTSLLYEVPVCSVENILYEVTWVRGNSQIIKHCKDEPYCFRKSKKEFLTPVVFEEGAGK
jgi:hypothetical protein